MWSLDSALKVPIVAICGSASASQRIMSAFSSSPSRWPRCALTTAVSCWRATPGLSPSTATTVCPAGSPVARCRATMR